MTPNGDTWGCLECQNLWTFKNIDRNGVQNSKKNQIVIDTS